MRVIARKTLRDYWEKHPDTEQPLKAWYAEAEKATWSCTNDILEEYSTASPVSGNRIVFNIKGNRYRLVVVVRYSFGKVYIRFVGTHAEYDKIDARTV